MTLSPGCKISGGKVLSSHTRKSNNRIAARLRLVATAVGRTDTALGAFYRRLAARIGKAKALTATARKIAILFYRAMRFGRMIGLEDRQEKARDIDAAHQAGARLQLACEIVGIDAAREWAADFVRWYNHDHRRSAIRYVTPAQRHAGDDHAILRARHALYTQARELNPARWSRHTRDWTAVGAVTLNPERDWVVEAHSHGINRQPLAA